MTSVRAATGVAPGGVAATMLLAHSVRLAAHTGPLAGPIAGQFAARVAHRAAPSVLAARHAHFDSNAFVQRLENSGIKREQADVLVTALTDVINESIENLMRGLVRRDEAEKHTYTQKVRTAAFRPAY